VWLIEEENGQCYNDLNDLVFTKKVYPNSSLKHDIMGKGGLRGKSKTA
jgi:hypothetical protein